MSKQYLFILFIGTYAFKGYSSKVDVLPSDIQIIDEDQQEISQEEESKKERLVLHTFSTVGNDFLIRHQGKPLSKDRGATYVSRHRLPSKRRSKKRRMALSKFVRLRNTQIFLQKSIKS